MPNIYDRALCEIANSSFYTLRINQKTYDFLFSGGIERAVNYFHKKAPSKMFDRVLNTPVNLVERFLSRVNIKETQVMFTVIVLVCLLL